MFPLGTVLFPHGVLPLHVFEPRYRTLVEEVLAREAPEFGVVLIERGSEVGGGDARFGVGTLARVVDAQRLPDGRYALVTVGTRRFRVVRWLPDDPYPQAEIEVLVDAHAGAGDTERRDAIERALHRVIGLAAELGARVGTEPPALAGDPVRAGWEAAALAPIGPLDALDILGIDDPSTRLDRLAAALHAAGDLLALRLGDPGPPDGPEDPGSSLS
jgi:Lon protease-like protein